MPQVINGNLKSHYVVMKATMGTPDDYGCKKKSLEALQ